MIPKTHATPVRAATVMERSQTSPALAIVEATLASGALVESPSNGGPTGMKWRVRIFEYGLSKNRIPIRGCHPLALARLYREARSR